MKIIKMTVLTIISFISVTSFAAEMKSQQTKGISKNMTQHQTLSPAEKNKQIGEAFLAENKKHKDVITLADGLQYKIIKAGSGVKPSDSDMVTVNYSGKLVNGKEFDSSYKRGEPASFPVNGVIPGWTEALKLMPEGSVWELYIPAKLAYGEMGAGSLIGPNETLIFKVELLKVEK